jgi:hypothetical protein
MPTAFPIPPTGLNFLSTSASALVKTGAGQCHLILVTASTAGTVKLWDAVSAAGTVIVDTMSVNANEEYDIPAQFNTGLYITIGGTATVTVFYI